MELLAPVGSKESFVTAIRGGANAVYIGVPDFNARVSAANINHYDLRVLIDHAREKNVKVFLALNTLIKHEEISDVVKSITYIEKLHPDAVIVQDLGIASIIKKYFPDISLHASTQMAVHSRMGIDFLARQGFGRVILARELSFSELKIITKGSPVPIEIFCHGALCFSLSGMCLFSSYIGGLSGNRGRCTQPCRRLWQNGDKPGYIFSPRDLELAEHINKLKNIGIASVKIEGRMRSSEYVYKTVKAYRMLIDASDADFNDVLKEAKVILSGDAAREKTTCLFSGRDNNIFQPKKAQCLGNLIGSIDDVKDGKLFITVIDNTVEIKEGDRLRLSNPATDNTIAFKVKEFSKEGLIFQMPFGKAEEFSCGNPVFKTVDTALDQKDIEKDIDSMYKAFQSKGRRDNRMEQKPIQTYTALISNRWKDLKNAAPGEAGEDSLWVRFDAIQWLDILPLTDKNIRRVFYLTKENMHLVGGVAANTLCNFACELPPFIGQRETALFKQCIDNMVAKGVTKWVLNNVSQFEFFRGSECELSAGPFLYTWNAYTAAFLADNGIKYFTISWEDDFLNIRKMCGPGLGRYVVFYLYGFVPAARSRMLTREMFCDDLIKDRLAPIAFTPAFESELTLLIPENPVSNFTARRKLKECGITNFGIDLCFIKPDRKLLAELFTSYKQLSNPIDSHKFNFKRGIK